MVPYYLTTISRKQWSALHHLSVTYEMYGRSKRGKRKRISKIKKVLKLINCSVDVKQYGRGSNYNQLEFRQRTTKFWMMDRSFLCMNVGYHHICITVEDSFVQPMLHLLTARYIYKHYKKLHPRNKKGDK